MYTANAAGPRPNGAGLPAAQREDAGKRGRWYNQEQRHSVQADALVGHGRTEVVADHVQCKGTQQRVACQSHRQSEHSAADPASRSHGYLRGEEECFEVPAFWNWLRLHRG